MINYKQYINRLKDLSVTHLNCRLDDHKNNYIPLELKEGSYRWFLYLYTNLFKEGDDIITSEDKKMFIQISTLFRTEHLISWVRNKIYQIREEKLAEINYHIEEILEKTYQLYIIRICLYLKRIFSERWFFIDDYILGKIPTLKHYIDVE